ncbi:hypothetical protein AK812_SmicGene3236 [Symbiodinium microadriaticum]|uniref:Uncharacterized protein n=1 Tax=Symbiodinium microadriaticum TaxID=2951 RepID=A0A1Q9EZP8_SYMMI|nr:hypothetical protein AK812_SmicGene3236 [Symbiodinium microadriaticum]
MFAGWESTPRAVLERRMSVITGGASIQPEQESVTDLTPRLSNVVAQAPGNLVLISSEAQSYPYLLCSIALVLVGKKWGSGSQHSSQPAAPWRSSPNAKWNWWPGAWSPRRQQDVELRYDQVAVKEQADYGMTEIPEREPSFHQALQKTLTTARKLDGKLRKIAAEKERRQKQWKKYEDGIRKSFAKQKKNFEADIARLDQEAQDTLEAGHMASAQVKAIAIKGVAPPPASEAMEVDAAWESLWKRVEEPPSGASFLQEAVAAAQSGLGGAVSACPGAGDVPRHSAGSAAPDGSVNGPPHMAHFGDPLPTDTSNQGPTEEELRILQKYWGSPGRGAPPTSATQAFPNVLPPRPPQPPAAKEGTGYSDISPVHGYHRSAPYPPTSPLHTPPPRPVDAKGPEPTRSDNGGAAGHLPTRAPVKEATKTLPSRPEATGVPLQAKLESKRDAMKGLATQPFRQPLRAAEGRGADTLDTGEPPGPQGGSNFVDDDLDELQSISPGLGRME